LRVIQSEGGLTPFYTFGLRTQSDETSALPSYPRVLAHLLLDALPEEAILQVLENLADAWIFHSSPVSAPIATMPKVLQGTITHRYERPVYALSDEE
jgi:hypothetical protein